MFDPASTEKTSPPAFTFRDPPRSGSTSPPAPLFYERNEFNEINSRRSSSHDPHPFPAPTAASCMLQTGLMSFLLHVDGQSSMARQKTLPSRRTGRFFSQSITLLESCDATVFGRWREMARSSLRLTVQPPRSLSPADSQRNSPVCASHNRSHSPRVLTRLRRICQPISSNLSSMLSVT